MRPPKPPVCAPSKVRLYRLRRGVRLADVATFSSLSMSRLSEIERNPENAYAVEVEELRRAVDRAAEFMSLNPSEGEDL